jgi:hypothetical protein
VAAAERGENPLRNIAMLFGAIWRTLRGADQRGRKVRWLIGLLKR